MRKTVWAVITLVLIMSVMVFTASCTKTVVQTQEVTTPEPEVQTEPDMAEEEPVQVMEQPQAEPVAREAEEPAFINENIHFAFDSAVLSEQARQYLNGMTDYLRTNQDITVIVEGHCDNRGTNEYNLALGQQRAESAKSYLIALGIVTDRLKTISYGEERPIAFGDNEESWARNRRAQFVIN